MFVDLLSLPSQPSHVFPKPQQDPLEKHRVFVNILKFWNPQMFPLFDLKLPFLSDACL